MTLDVWAPDTRSEHAFEFFFMLYSLAAIFEVTVLTGCGSPSALQLSVAGSFLATYWSSGCSIIRGFVTCCTAANTKEAITLVSECQRKVVKDTKSDKEPLNEMNEWKRKKRKECCTKNLCKKKWWLRESFILRLRRWKRCRKIRNVHV